MTYRSNNCPLPHDVPGCAVIDTSSSHLSFNGYNVVIERGEKMDPYNQCQEVIFNDFRDGTLYASPI